MVDEFILNNFIKKYYCREPKVGDIAFHEDKIYYRATSGGLWLEYQYRLESKCLNVDSLFIEILKRLVYVHGCRETLKLRVKNALKEG